jgi:hypothetical protein
MHLGIISNFADNPRNSLIVQSSSLAATPAIGLKAVRPGSRGVAVSRDHPALPGAGGGSGAAARDLAAQKRDRTGDCSAARALAVLAVEVADTTLTALIFARRSPKGAAGGAAAELGLQHSR